jgi:hypothetical protein
MAVPIPKGASAKSKIGPPDTVTISFRATAADWREFYSKALPRYRWQAAGNCWQRPHPTSNKTETLCLEPSGSGAVVQITEK